MKTCTKCGAPMKEDELFCGECGAGQGTPQDQGNPQGQQNPPGQGNGNLPKGMVCKKKLLWVAVTVAVLVVVIGGGTIFSKHFSPKPTQNLIYSKRNTTIQYSPKNGKSLELTHRATADKSFDEILLSNNNVVYSEDGKYVFYTENLNDDYNGTLMYKNLKKQSGANDTSEKLASGVSSCQPLSSGKILYTNEDDNGYKDLYLSDLNDKTKIGSDISRYTVSQDGSCLIYTTDDDDLYFYDLTKKDASKVKLDSDVSFISASDDLSCIYYQKDSTLMCIKNQKDPEQIAHGLDNDGSFKVKGNSVYYLIPTSTYKVTDYMIDNTYSQKQDKEEIRSALKDKDSFSLYDLYLYDGKSSAKIADSVAGIEYDLQSLKNGKDMVICIVRMEPDKLKKLKFSDLGSKYDVSINIKKWKSTAMNYALVTGANVRPFDAEGMLNTSMFDYKNHIYYYTLGSSLYSISYSQTAIKEPKLISDDAYYPYLAGEQLVYGTGHDMGSNSLTLYVNGKKVDDDVSMAIRLVPGGPDDSVYYAKNMNFKDYTTRNDHSFTLYCYRKGKKIKVADDITCFKPLENGMIAYLQDYDLDTHRGDLYLWRPEKARIKVDEDVSFIQNSFDSFSAFFG